MEAGKGEEKVVDGPARRNRVWARERYAVAAGFPSSTTNATYAADIRSSRRHCCYPCSTPSARRGGSHRFTRTFPATASSFPQTAELGKTLDQNRRSSSRASRAYRRAASKSWIQCTNEGKSARSVHSYISRTPCYQVFPNARMDGAWMHMSFL